MFARSDGLPPYLLAELDNLKRDLQRGGRDVIDLCLGSPDLPAPRSAIDALVRSADEVDASRYMPSGGLLELREALARWYERRHGVALDPVREIAATLGSKEGIAHLLLAMLDPGDAVLVPTPSYPVHHFGVVIAGGVPAFYPVGPDRDPLVEIERAYQAAKVRPRALIINYPHNPTAAVCEPETLERIAAFAAKHDLWTLSDIAYADIGFDGYRAPSALAVRGVRERTVEFVTLSKGRSMAGWRVGFCAGSPRLVGALTQLKRYLDYGMFQPIQRGAIAALDDDAYGETIAAIYQARRDALCDELARGGFDVPPPRASMFVWGRLPPAAGPSSLDFARKLLTSTGVAVAPGITFGQAGEGAVRFGLVEPEPRLREAARRIAAFLRGDRPDGSA